MPSVKFYHNAPDRLAAVCSIAAKAMRQGRRVVIFSRDAVGLGQCDQFLWVAQAASFVPHVAQGSPLAARTPILLSGDLAGCPHQDVLINLDEALPTSYTGFETLVEVVPQDEQSRQSARQRWASYKAQGYAPEGFDLPKTP